MPESIVTILDIAIGGLLLGSIYALIAMGLSLQYGVARVLNISHGEFIMIGAYLTLTLYTVVDINPLLCLVIIGPAIFVIGFILQRTLFTYLRIKAPNPGAYESNSLLAAFGIMFIIQSIALMGWGADYQAYTYLNEGVNIGGAIFSKNKLVILGFSLGIGVAFYMFLASTRIGKGIRAAAQDPSTASLMGVNINHVLALCFGFGAAMAGIAGALYSMRITLNPAIGMQYTIIAIIVIVLGGLGSIPGAFLGGLILGIIGEVVTYFDPSLSLAAYYLIFMVLLLVRPKGIFGK